MGKGKKFNLMSILTMLIMVVLWSSCEALSMDTTSDEEREGYKFTYNVVNNGNSAIIYWKVSDQQGNQVESGQAAVSCSHEHDGYAGPKTTSVAYAQQNTSHGALTTSTKSSTETKTVKEVSGKTTAKEDDGNLLYAHRSYERVTRVIDGKEVEMPYIEVGEPVLKDIAQLPGTAMTRADEFKADSVCRQPEWVYPCFVRGADVASFDVPLKDLFRVYQMEANDVESAKKIAVDRIPTSEEEERGDITIEYLMKDKTTHTATKSVIMKRKWTPKAEWEEIVKNFVYSWRSTNPWSNGSSSEVRKDGDFTVSGKTDKISQNLSNEGNANPITTEYSFYHEKAEYKDEYGVQHVFDYITPEVSSRNPSVEDAAKSGYTAKRLTDVIATSYLGYNQDVKETVLLLQEQAYIQSEGWVKAVCTETTEDGNTTWYTKYEIHYSDGTTQTYEWRVSEPRVLENDGPWNSTEKNSNNTTGGVTVTKTSSEKVTKNDNGAVITYDRESYSMTSDVTLNGSVQKNKWHSREGNNFSITFRDKTFSFDGRSVTASNTASLGAGSKSGNNTVYPYSVVLSYNWGSNKKSSNGSGTITIAEENTFFPPEWGALLEAQQTVTNNKSHTGFVYCWSLRFEKGTLPVIVASGSKTPDWQFSYFEYTSERYNSATYQESTGKWVNSVASDQVTQMTWTRAGKEIANKDYTVAKSNNWDEGHTHNGHVSVFTSRYDLQVSDGRLTATDTYSNTYMGSWK